MKKESSVTLKTGELSGRVTRARAAAHCSSGKLPPLKERSQQNQKQLSRVNSKRAASDNTCVPRKKRTVLQDVTNVCCENAYTSCVNSNKIQVFSMTKPQPFRARKYFISCCSLFTFFLEICCWINVTFMES